MTVQQLIDKLINNTLPSERDETIRIEWDGIYLIPLNLVARDGIGIILTTKEE